MIKNYITGQVAMKAAQMASLSYADIGTSTMQSRAFAGLSNGTFVLKGGVLTCEAVVTSQV